VEIMTQRIELLSVAPGESTTGEPTVILTIRPDRKSFRPHNIALSRRQAIRLLRSLRTVLRQSACVLLFGLALGLLAGCSAEVQVATEKTVPRADAEAAPPATKERTTTDVAVHLLDHRKPSPVEESSPARPAAPAPPPDPKQAVEVVGDGNAVLVVEGDLHVHKHRHVHVYEAPQLERVEIEIRRYDVEPDERCERLRREYEAKVRQLQRMFYER
jgi:hypothetical protein